MQLITHWSGRWYRITPEGCVREEVQIIKKVKGMEEIDVKKFTEEVLHKDEEKDDDENEIEELRQAELESAYLGNAVDFDYDHDADPPSQLDQEAFEFAMELMKNVSQD